MTARKTTSGAGASPVRRGATDLENSSRVFEPEREKIELHLDSEVTETLSDLEKYLRENKGNRSPNKNGIVEHILLSYFDQHAKFREWQRVQARKLEEANHAPGNRNAAGRDSIELDTEEKNVLENIKPQTQKSGATSASGAPATV